MKSRALHSTVIVTADRGLAAVWWSLAQHARSDVKVRTPGPELQEELRREIADVVVLDLDAENIDGLAVVEELRKEYSDLEIPWIIALKAEVSANDADAAMAAGINDLVAKSGDSEAYLSALQSADRVLHRRGVA